MASPASPPSPHVVGNMFVEQYYSILHHKPEEVYKFYKDSSILSRPGLNGEMTSVTTMQTIDEMIRSLDYGSYKVVIGTVDAQHSYKDGVIVLVTGCLTRKENKTLQKFAQSFFLAPQENGGFFVLNDVFRYVSDSQLVEINYAAKNGTTEVMDVPVDLVPASSGDNISHTPDPITILPEDQPKIDEEIKNSIKTDSQADDAGATVNVSIVPPDMEVITADPVVQVDAPKKSYASIVKVVKESGTTTASAPVAKVKVTRVATEKQVAASAVVSPPETSVSNGNSALENSNPHEEVEGYSIYVSNLPRNATPSQLEVEFQKFGPIKPGGVQVRNHKQNNYCFGFVEFESLSSMRSALEFSSIVMGGRQLVVEVKRTRTRVGNSSNNNNNDDNGSFSGRGRFPPARGGFRNDNYRGRGGFGGGQGGGYGGRIEFRSRGEFSNRGRPPPPARTGGEGYHHRVGRADVVNPGGVSA